jgi:hypothetical protein
MSGFARRGILGLSLAIAGVFAAPAQTPPHRPFDTASGILVSCLPIDRVEWTAAACQRLIAEVQRRGTATKVPVAAIDYAADLMRRKFDGAGAFDLDKAIRMRLSFAASTAVIGRINLALGANTIWEPTAKDIPNVAPGQRLVRNFYIIDLQFEPGVKLRDAEPYLAKLLDGFFAYGDSKL